MAAQTTQPRPPVCNPWPGRSSCAGSHVEASGKPTAPQGPNALVEVVQIDDAQEILRRSMLKHGDRGAFCADRQMKMRGPTIPKTRKDPIGLRRNSYVCIHMYHEHFYIYVFYVSHRLLRTREPRVCAYTFACVLCCVCMTVILFLFCRRW